MNKIGENSKDEPIWTYSAMTETGAYTLAKTVRDKMGCTILEKPMLHENGLWFFMFTNPFLDVDIGDSG